MIMMIAIWHEVKELNTEKEEAEDKSKNIKKMMLKVMGLIMKKEISIKELEEFVNQLIESKEVHLILNKEEE